MSLSLDISVCWEWAVWHPWECHGRTRSSVCMAVHTGCLLAISVCLRGGSTRLLPLSGDQVQDHPINLKCIFCHPDVCYFVCLVCNVNNTLAKKIHLLLYGVPLPSPSFNHSVYSKTSMGNLQENSLWASECLMVSQLFVCIFLLLHRFFLGRHQLFFGMWIVFSSCSCAATAPLWLYHCLELKMVLASKFLQSWVDGNVKQKGKMVWMIQTQFCQDFLNHLG